MASVLSKAARRVGRTLSGAIGRARDQARATYALSAPTHTIARRLKPFDTPALRSLCWPLRAVAEHWLAHRFDLLGSGWTRVAHGIRCPSVQGSSYASGPTVQADARGDWLVGRINEANLAESQRIWRFVDDGYTPIDWQLDFKSGHRWREDCWSADVSFGHRRGVDIKVPWELSRMQHLPQLAWCHALARVGEPGCRSPSVYAWEFRNQVLDFMATNPPRFGANWHCAMDVAIRAANWLVAFDLFRAWGARFDAGFETAFSRSIYEHGVHIIRHLERYGHIRGNHYLADIAGLIFIAAYLSRSPQTEQWLAFAVGELISEVEFQFHAEGTTFEASTSYHRLSAEMVAFATAVAMGCAADRSLPRRPTPSRRTKINTADSGTARPANACYAVEHSLPFPEWYFPRLERMAEFSVHVTKPNHRIHQVGDNDSGRFLKLQPTWEEFSVAQARRFFGNLSDYTELADEATYWFENQLDHRSLVAAINGLVRRDDLRDFHGPQRIELEIVQQLSRCAELSEFRARCARPTDDLVPSRPVASEPKLWEQLESDGSLARYPYEIPIPGPDLRDGVVCYSYTDFGLFIYRSPRLYLAVRCGRLAAGSRGAHAHHDQLAIELNVDGRDLIADPGTYVYTPDPKQRNDYRSAAAHFVPHAPDGREPGQLTSSLFYLADHARAECLLFEPYRFLGRHVGFGYPVHRAIEVTAQAIRITDYIDRRFPLQPPGRAGTGADFQAPLGPVPFSDGYGLQRTR